MDMQPAAAHNLTAMGSQIPRLQADVYFSSTPVSFFALFNNIFSVGTVVALHTHKGRSTVRWAFGGHKVFPFMPKTSIAIPIEVPCTDPRTVREDDPYECDGICDPYPLRVQLLPLRNGGSP